MQGDSIGSKKKVVECTEVTIRKPIQNANKTQKSWSTMRSCLSILQPSNFYQKDALIEALFAHPNCWVHANQMHDAFVYSLLVHAFELNNCVIQLLLVHESVINSSLALMCRKTRSFHCQGIIPSFSMGGWAIEASNVCPLLNDRCPDMCELIYALFTLRAAFVSIRIDKTGGEWFADYRVTNRVWRRTEEGMAWCDAFRGLLIDCITRG